MKKNRFGVIVRPALDEADGKAIAAFRDAWYAKSGKPQVPVPPDAVWFVGEWALEKRIVACMAVIAPELTNGYAYVSDMYCDENREGKLGLRAFLEKLDELPAQKATSVPLENEGLLKILHSAGYRDVEVTLTKEPDCLKPSSPPSSELVLV